MESLFLPKYFTYSPKAGELDRETREVIKPIIKKWIDKGYNPKEIENIMMSALSMEIVFEHSKNNMAIRKAEKEIGE